jgi:hypothetical protein
MKMCTFLGLFGALTLCGVLFPAGAAAAQQDKIIDDIFPELVIKRDLDILFIVEAKPFNEIMKLQGTDFYSQAEEYAIRCLKNNDASRLLSWTVL